MTETTYSAIADPSIKNYVRCSGACGFEAKSDDATVLEEMHHEHVCGDINGVQKQRTRFNWKDVFNGWTFLIVVTICCTIIFVKR